MTADWPGCLLDVTVFDWPSSTTLSAPVGEAFWIFTGEGGFTSSPRLKESHD
jgi:hypothetical protein